MTNSQIPQYPPRLRRRTAMTPLELYFLNNYPDIAYEIEIISDNIDNLRRERNLPPHPNDQFFDWRLRCALDSLMERILHFPEESRISTEARMMIRVIRQFQRDT